MITMDRRVEWAQEFMQTQTCQKCGSKMQKRTSRPLTFGCSLDSCKTRVEISNGVIRLITYPRVDFLMQEVWISYIGDPDSPTAEA